ncbi:Tn3 family transposase [Streptomyces sp. NBC_01563]|uniref:Tn3 family transposase n=1 Tax=Streptomyces sp. NBC_01563 TaxID=2975880 RepID=UPI00386F980F
MTSIERTAYPRFKRLITAHELYLFFSPTRDELQWAADATDGDEHLLALLLMLKSYQRMGCFPALEDVPEQVVEFVRRQVELPEGTLPLYRAERTAKHHRGLVRKKVGVKYDQGEARRIAERSIRKEAAAKNRPADLINIALEKVVEAGLELPGFSTFDKMASEIRTEAEVGRVIRTVQLLRYLCDPALRRRVTAATNKTEAFNGFSQWIGFGNRGVIADNDPVEQEKAMKFNALLTNAVIFHNALDIAEIVRQLLEEGWTIEPEDLAHISPYLTGHINRFGEYSTHELGIQPEAYDPKLDVDFTQLRDQDLTAAGLRQAA